MTLIECYSGVPLEDISACLNLRPEKLIFLGNTAQMAQNVQRYRALLSQRKLAKGIQGSNAVTALSLQKGLNFYRKVR